MLVILNPSKERGWISAFRANAHLVRPIVLRIFANSSLKTRCSRQCGHSERKPVRSISQLLLAQNHNGFIHLGQELIKCFHVLKFVHTSRVSRISRSLTVRVMATPILSAAVCHRPDLTESNASNLLATSSPKLEGHI